MGKVDDLYITVPSFFRCPISLDVMKSPVSLSTGVTYDRASIQRWLDSGNNTCPATMQVLDSKDFVPNHTLHRLIQIWSTTRQQQQQQPQSLSVDQALDLVNRVINETSPFDGLVKLLCFGSETPENRRFLASNDAFVEFLFGLVSGLDPNPEVLEAGLKILQIISPKRTVLTILKTHPEFLTSMGRILRKGSSDSKVAVSGILEAVSPDPESKKAVFDNDELLSAMLRALWLAGTSESASVSESVSILCALISLSSPRRNKVMLVRAGGVRILTELIDFNSADTTITTTITNNKSNNTSATTPSTSVVTMTELVLTLLEMLAGSAEGRAAITDNPNCIPRIVQKMMKVSSTANEHAVALLWSLCYLFRDQKAREAVMRSNGGLTKILLLMQSNCSPAVKRMCCDLLRIFRVNSKSCLSSYDTKTTHIMPC